MKCVQDFNDRLVEYNPLKGLLYNELFNIRNILKDTVSVDVQGFFDNNNNFILKEIGNVFEKEPNLNNSF